MYAHGMQNDRKYMVVDAETGMFVAQRGSDGLGIAIRTMCQIIPQQVRSDDYFTLTAPNMPYARFCSDDFDPGNLRDVQVWKFRHYGIRASQVLNDWFTEFLGRERKGKYELVMIPKKFERRAKIGYSQLRFADAYPFLVISEESLIDLNHRIGSPEPLPMNRFRPNIVIEGGAAFDEDRLDRFSINGVDFEGQTLCVRCPIPCTNQETAVLGKEPSATLSRYRRGRHLRTRNAPDANGVYFGRNFNHLSTGVLHVGDRVNWQTYDESR